MKQPETILIYQAINQAGQGRPEELQNLIVALTKERDNLVQVANSRIATLNGQIGLLQTILTQASQNGHSSASSS